jgi:hypothetical protein
MNDEYDPEMDPELDPEQDERVRALLADLGMAPDTALPPEVAARLDETLAGLVAERPGVPVAATEETRTNVVPLRRRWVPRAAAAAAAVIVVGVGGVAVANLGLFDGSAKTADSSAGGSADSKAQSLDGTATAQPSNPSALPGGLAARLPRVRAASFDTDVARLLQQAPAPLGAVTDSQRRSQEEAAGGDSLAARCAGPTPSDGSTTTPVLYDGTAAVLVVHPAHGGRRLVQAWTCGGDRVLDSAHVPAQQQPSTQSSPGDPGLGSPSPTP